MAKEKEEDPQIRYEQMKYLYFLVESGAATEEQREILRQWAENPWQALCFTKILLIIQVMVAIPRMRIFQVRKEKPQNLNLLAHLLLPVVYRIARLVKLLPVAFYLR